jgi:hypothetical protein
MQGMGSEELLTLDAKSETQSAFRYYQKIPYVVIII